MWPSNLAWLLAPEQPQDPLVMAAVVVSVLSGLATFGSAALLFYKARADKKNIETQSISNEATASKTISEATVVILNPLREEVAALRSRLKDAEKRIDELEATVEQKTHELDLKNIELHRERERAAIERRGFEDLLRKLNRRIAELGGTYEEADPGERSAGGNTVHPDGT